MTYLRSSKGNKAPLKASKEPLKATNPSLTKPLGKKLFGVALFEFLEKQLTAKTKNRLKL